MIWGNEERHDGYLCLLVFPVDPPDGEARLSSMEKRVTPGPCPRPTAVSKFKQLPGIGDHRGRVS